VSAIAAMFAAEQQMHLASLDTRRYPLFLQTLPATGPMRYLGSHSLYTGANAGACRHTESHVFYKHR